MHCRPNHLPRSGDGQLADAMKVNAKGNDRLVDRGQVLRACAQTGIICRQRARRSDFADTYILRKPSNLRHFAEGNHCDFGDGREPKQRLNHRVPSNDPHNYRL